MDELLTRRPPHGMVSLSGGLLLGELLARTCALTLFDPVDCKKYMISV